MAAKNDVHNGSSIPMMLGPLFAVLGLILLCFVSFAIGTATIILGVALIIISKIYNKKTTNNKSGSPIVLGCAFITLSIIFLACFSNYATCIATLALGVALIIISKIYNKKTTNNKFGFPATFGLSFITLGTILLVCSSNFAAGVATITTGLTLIITQILPS